MSDLQSNRVSGSDGYSTAWPRRSRLADSNVPQSALFDQLLRMPLFDGKIPDFKNTEPNEAVSKPVKSEEKKKASSEDEPSSDAASSDNSSQQAASVVASAQGSFPKNDVVLKSSNQVATDAERKTKSDASQAVTETPVGEIDAASLKANESRPDSKASSQVTQVNEAGSALKPDVASASTQSSTEFAAEAVAPVTPPTHDGEKAAKDSKGERKKNKIDSNESPLHGERARESNLSLQSGDNRSGGQKQDSDVKTPSKQVVAKQEVETSSAGKAESGFNDHSNRRQERLAEKTRSASEHANTAQTRESHDAVPPSSGATTPQVTLSANLPSVATPTQAPINSTVVPPINNPTTVTPSAIAPVTVVTGIPQASGSGQNTTSTVKDTSPVVSATSITGSAATGAAWSSGSPAASGTSAPKASPDTPSGGRTSNLSAYQETKLVQRVLRGLEQLGNGGGQVRMRLHPPELGSLQMTLRIEAGQMTAHMEVETSTARDALVQNVQVLRDKLAEQGIQIEKFDVQVGSQQTPLGSNGQSSDGGSNSGRQDRMASRYADQNANRIDASTTPVRADSPRFVDRNAALDLKV